MKCNIDAKGKAVRFKLGLIAVAGALFGSIMILSGILDDPLFWYPTAGTAAGGLLALFEARTGWCVVRAMGFKTPL